MVGGIDMTQEEKELLLKDLCARLPYGVKFACNKNVYTATGLDLIVTDEGYWEYAIAAKNIAPIEIYYIKPYLFPTSSMTEEQKLDLKEYAFVGGVWGFDWCHKNHFDYRGLIPQGLAIDATGLNIY